MAGMSPLRRCMIDYPNLSPTKHRSYVHALAKFASCFGRCSPCKLLEVRFSSYEFIID